MIWMKRIQAIVIVAIVASLLALVIVPMTGAFTEDKLFLEIVDMEMMLENDSILKSHYQTLLQKDKKLEYLFLAKSQDESLIFDELSQKEPEVLTYGDFKGYIIIQTGSYWTRRAQALIEARQQEELLTLREEYINYMETVMDSWQGQDRVIVIGDLFNPLSSRTKVSTNLNQWIVETNKELYKIAYRKQVLVAPLYESLKSNKQTNLFVEGKLNQDGVNMVGKAFTKVLRDRLVVTEKDQP